MELKEYFRQPYQGRNSFLKNVIFPIFGKENFEEGYDEPLLENNPELSTTAAATGIAAIYRIGTIELDFNPINIFDIQVSNHVQLTRNRVGVQQLVRRIMSTYSSAFMIFHYNDAESWDWRFSFCSKRGNDNTTDSKRYTFLLGPGQSCRTATENFKKLLDKNGNIELKDIEKAFDVEALSDEFFEKYKSHYERFVQYITGKRFVKEAGKWKEKVLHEPHSTIYDAFGRNDKLVRDYVKKLLGRIVFLHFLQKKGWMGVPKNKQWGEGDLQFMKNLYEHCTEEQKENFLDEILEPLFSNGIDTPRENDLFDTGVALENGSVVKIPYLNGGLFERDTLDKVNTRFPANFFADLLNFFYQYNFTIDENDPNDAQVGVDPEMLGRIFENLLEDNKDKGAYYTPKEIVRYMCRQSLISYLQTNINDEAQRKAIEGFVKTYNIEFLGDKDSSLTKLIDQRLCDVKICDPAIGSGAFPMGLLRELFLCRGAIEDFHNAADIKRHIIQENIYGVDYERGAVDIARLRFWLSLIVDEETPQSLPNLDYKIMQGNSLLESYKDIDLSRLAKDSRQLVSETQVLELFDNMLDIYRKQLREMVTSYYSETDHTRKQKLMKKIRENVLTQIKESGLDVDLSDIDLQANAKFFLWHTWFADVLNRPSGCNGFDIVIGNPPYISAPAQIDHPFLAQQREDIIANKRFESLYQKWDLYIPFIELGMQLARNGGIITMIVPYPLTNQTYGKRLREMIVSKHDLFELCDLNGTKIFENVTVSNCIPFIRKSLSSTSMTIISHINEAKTIMQVFQKEIDAFMPDKKTAVWNMDEIKRKTNRHSGLNVLGDYCYISVGMVINADEKTAKGAFKKDDLISYTQDEVHCRKYIEAKDIEKYSVKRVRYLEYNTDRCPTQLRRPTFRELYDYSRLILNCLGRINATIDETEHYLHNHSIYCAVPWHLLSKVNNKSITSSIKKFSHKSRTQMEELSQTVDLKFLLGVMNSKYADELLTNLRGGDYHIYPEHIRNIPIPNAPVELQQSIVNLVDKILLAKINNSDTTILETKVDQLVFKIYSLQE